MQVPTKCLAIFEKILTNQILGIFVKDTQRCLQPKKKKHVSSHVTSTQDFYYATNTLRFQRKWRMFSGNPWHCQPLPSPVKLIHWSLVGPSFKKFTVLLLFRMVLCLLLGFAKKTCTDWVNVLTAPNWRHWLWLKRKILQGIRKIKEWKKSCQVMSFFVPSSHKTWAMTSLMTSESD